MSTETQAPTGPDVTTERGVAIPHLSILAIAGVCHEQNRAFCMTLGDFSQEPWASAPEWARISAVSGVTAIAQGRVKFAEDSHRNWSEDKVRDGWTYGPTKDVEKKQHPCLVPFGELSADQQAKDSLFLFTALTLLRRYDRSVGQIMATVDGPGDPLTSYPLTEEIIDDLNRRFTYHAPKGDQPKRYGILRSRALGLAEFIQTLCPPSAERTLALRKVEEASMWANASIARNE